ncbi:MAG: NAD-dependent epimerase/dehydratase family protein [Acidimicrobiia bacterium]|nr:NAD-dependent epimerase/dehydratase family protein [Acidimicrobiia bacterium]
MNSESVSAESEPVQPVTVLITGTSGFIGLNLLEALSPLPHRVVGLADRPIPDKARAALAEPRLVPVLETIDIRDPDAVAEATERYRPDVVIHAAAVTAGPERERNEARAVIDVNIGGTQSVLDACSAAGVRRLVHVSSGAVYGRAAFGPDRLDETTPVVPTTYYGITKLAAEQLSHRHAELHDLDVVVARLSAVFGPWEYPTGVRDFMSPMLQMVEAARDGTPIRLVADRPRNWVYALDAARALVALALKPELGHDCYNLCPETTTTTVRFLERLAAAYADAGAGIDDAIVDDPEQATIVFDADPRLRRAPVSSWRITQELGAVEREERHTTSFWTSPDDAFDGYIAWARTRSGTAAD